jgi:hypothetical protein
MANPIYYYDGLEDATLTYSGTEDTDFTVENLKNRNKNTFFKDTDVAANSVTLDIDFGANRTCDHILFGNYLATAVGALESCDIDLDRSDTGAFGGEETSVIADETIDSSSLTDTVVAFSSATDRYWRITFKHSAAGNLDDLQFAIILLGTKLNHTVNRNWGMYEGRLSNVSMIITKGGVEFSNKNGNNRKIYEMFWEDIGNTHRGNIMTWLETVCNNHLPFYLDVEGDGTLLLVRKRGIQGGVRDKDYQVEDTDRFTFVEQL